MTDAQQLSLDQFHKLDTTARVHAEQAAKHPDSPRVWMEATERWLAATDYWYLRVLRAFGQDIYAANSAYQQRYPS